MKRLASLLAAFLVAALFLSACGSSGGPVAAKVNGDEISQDTLNADLKAFGGNKGFAAQVKQSSNLDVVRPDGTFNIAIASSWLNNLLGQQLIDREVAKRHLKISAAARTAAKTQVTQQFGGAKIFAKFPAAFQTRLIDRRARVTALGTALAKKQLTQAKLQATFEASKAQCASGKLVSHILVKTQAEADQVSQALAQGTAFADIAKQVSTDSGSGALGGIVTCVDSSDWAQLDPTFRQNAEATAVGSVSQPFQTQFGYHIVKVDPYNIDTARPLLEQAAGDPLVKFVTLGLRKGHVTVDRRYGKLKFSNGAVTIVPPKTPAAKNSSTTSSTQG